jgi:hypothetical protein
MFQYPKESAIELGAGLKIGYRLNNIWRSQEYSPFGPKPLNLSVDARGFIQLEIIQVPNGYIWHEWVGAEGVWTEAGERGDEGSAGIGSQIPRYGFHSSSRASLASEAEG